MARTRRGERGCRAMCEKLINSKKIKISWVICRERIRVTSTKCYKCLAKGHTFTTYWRYDQGEAYRKYGKVLYKVNICNERRSVFSGGIAAHPVRALRILHAWDRVSNRDKDVAYTIRIPETNIHRVQALTICLRSLLRRTKRDLVLI